MRLDEYVHWLSRATPVVAVIMVLAGLLLPAGSPRGKAKRINCVSNLKQIGSAFRIWEGDHGGRYPMSVYTNALGAPQFANSANAYRYFLAMSNELNNPKILICPADAKRDVATNFNADFNGSHISYFIGLQAEEIHPQTFLAGDSNLTNGMKLRTASWRSRPTNLWDGARKGTTAWEMYCWLMAACSSGAVPP